jgi:uncharacterized protein YceH (UPF0502 family)
MEALLHPVEVRVLGALIEKEITTPEYYPLTLNALVAACNQKSNRDPVMSIDDDSARRALESLQAKRLSATIIAAGSRAPKFEQRLSSSWNLGRREIALLDVLMLRGPQTVGELRDRSERMFSFQDLEEVEHCLESMMQRQPPLVSRLARQVGRKEPRYAQLLAGEPDWDASGVEIAVPGIGSDRLSALEEEVRKLREELDDLKRQLMG